MIDQTANLFNANLLGNHSSLPDKQEVEHFSIDKDEKIKQLELLLEDKNTVIEKQAAIIKKLETRYQHGNDWQI